MPTVALAIAGASLTPSPTIATSPEWRSAWMAATLSSGSRSPRTRSMPTARPTDSATTWASPEIMMVVSMPNSWSRRMTSRAASRGVSMSPTTPKNRPPRWTSIVERPSALSWRSASRSAAGAGAPPSKVNRSGLPTATGSPASTARTPWPVTLWRSWAGAPPVARSARSRTTARANGCSLSRSTATTASTSSASVAPSAGTTSVTRGAPSVSVPVLSKAMDVRPPRASSGPPPLTSTPLRPARATPESTADGVAMASAHGDAATRTAIAR